MTCAFRAVNFLLLRAAYGSTAGLTWGRDLGSTLGSTPGLPWVDLGSTPGRARGSNPGRPGVDPGDDTESTLALGQYAAILSGGSVRVGFFFNADQQICA